MKEEDEGLPFTNFDLLVFGSVVLIFVSLLFVTIFDIYKSLDVQTVTVEITDKIVKRYESDLYLVFSDKETFKISNSTINWRWDSSDMYGKLRVNKKYKLKVCGWRIKFLSWYRNILDAEEIETNDE